MILGLLVPFSIPVLFPLSHLCVSLVCLQVNLIIRSCSVSPPV